MAWVPASLTGKYLTTGERWVSGGEICTCLPLSAGQPLLWGVQPEDRHCVEAAGDTGMLGRGLALQGSVLKLSVVRDRYPPAFQDRRGPHWAWQDPACVPHSRHQGNNPELVSDPLTG